MHNIFTEGIPLINENLFITTEEIQNQLLLLQSYSKMDAGFMIPTYLETTKKNLSELKNQTTIALTMDYSDSSLDNAVAYHRMKGTIYYDCCYYFFSTKTFIREILEAENNPGIVAHLIVVSSGGGVAYAIQNAVDALASCKKPVIVLTEVAMASAALYLCLPATKIYCSTNFDTVGSIGTMVGYWDMSAYLKNLGFNLVEAYATDSTHKNKKYSQLEKGETEEYIKQVLNPLQAEFRKSVERFRPETLKAPEEAHVFNGETWFAQEAINYGLVDGFNKSIAECANEAYNLGLKHKEKVSTHNKLYSLIK